MCDEKSVQLLFVTDCPFWQNRTGAQQRILSLARYIGEHPYQIETLFCGKLSGEDKKILAGLSLNVEPVFRENPPTGFIAKKIWQLRCIWFWAKSKISSRNLASESDAAEGKQLEEFHSPYIGKVFRQKLRQFKPQIVIIEYISLAYLASYIPRELRDEIVLAIDTHDVMHSRRIQFLQTGHDHWIYIDEDQERKALQDFDLIIAIQEDERDEFRRILPNATILVAQHSVQCKKLSPRKQESDRVSIGYFGSANASNSAAINSFIEDVWPIVVNESNGQPRLVIAGSVCESLHGHDIPNCEVVGTIDEVESFYEKVDVVVNPVSFGTGLKIKNLEALAFGKCLVTSTAGFAGMPAAAKQAFIVVDSVEHFAKTLLQLIHQPELRNSISQAAQEYTKHFLDRDSVYQPLLRKFAEIRCQQKNSQPVA